VIAEDKTTKKLAFKALAQWVQRLRSARSPDRILR
jgi:hypothetical protein